MRASAILRNRQRQRRDTVVPCPGPHWYAYIGLVAVVCLGCTGNSASRPTMVERQGGFGDERLDYVVSNLGRLDEFDDEAMRRQIVSQLNAWARGRKPPEGWEVDPMVETLPESLRSIPLVQGLAEMEFLPYDGYTLYEAATLRDVSDWAAGERVDPIDQARHLFDWTVRNIQLEPEKEGTSSSASAAEFQSPWRTLLFGRGTAVDRAWVFILLLRQRSIDSVILALPDPRAPETLTPWAVGVLTENGLYLFDPLLGLPIPAADGISVEKDEGLTIRPATLEEIVQKPELLRALDLDEDTPYPVDAKSLENVTALLEASPAYLSARMDLLASQLVGDARMVLTAVPSTLADRLKKYPQIKKTALWERPYQVAAAGTVPSEPMRRALAVRMRPFRLERRIERSVAPQAGEETVSQAQAPFMRYVGENEEGAERRVVRAAPLWKARMLYLKGQFLGDEGATAYFQMARPSNQALSGIAAAAESGQPEEVRGAEVKSAWERAKQDASYWLGLMNYERGKYGPAEDYLLKRVLDPPKADSESSPECPWTSGATYNLARTYEAEGRLIEAIGTYRKNQNRPNRWQSELRARLLESSEKPRE